MSASALSLVPGNYSAVSALLCVISYKLIPVDAFTRVKLTSHYSFYFLAIKYGAYYGKFNGFNGLI